MLISALEANLAVRRLMFGHAGGIDIDSMTLALSGSTCRGIACGASVAKARRSMERCRTLLIQLRHVASHVYHITECIPGTRTVAGRYSEAGSIGFPGEGVETRIVGLNGNDAEAEAGLIVGRRKEMIIRSGFNVYPAGVKAALNRLPEVAACAVVSRRLADTAEMVVAFVELRPGCKTQPPRSTQRCVS